MKIMMNEIQLIEVFKALSNETRLNILKWLKTPDECFPPQGAHLSDKIELKGGVCVGSIQEKAGVSQSTVSHYLDIMLRARLLKAERHGKWTYYSRDEETIQALIEHIKMEL
jgi:DNA-binding transcriptional ArsR family regulator